MHLQIRPKTLVTQRLAEQQSPVRAKRKRGGVLSAIARAVLGFGMVVAARLAEIVIPRLPRPCVPALAWLLGWLGFFFLPGKRRRIALANMEVAFGASMTPARRNEVLRRSLGNLALVALDMFWFLRDKSRRIKKYVAFEPGFHDGLESSPHIFATAHFGNWELGGQALAEHGYRMVIPHATLHNAAGERVLSRLRSGSKVEFVPRDNASRTIWRVLREGGSLGLAMDQNSSPQEGGFTELFGLPVAAPLAIGRLALRCGAPIAPVFCVPTERGHYRFYRRSSLSQEAMQTADADGLSVTQWVMDQFQQEITARPELWFWLHRRWKHIPRDYEQAKEFPFYARPVPQATAKAPQ